MAPIQPTRIFIIGGTGYVGATVTGQLLASDPDKTKYSIRSLSRSPEKAEQDLVPLGIVPVHGTLDDLALLEKEAADADVVLSIADCDHMTSVQALLRGLQHRPRLDGSSRKRPILIHTSGACVLLDTAHGEYGSDTIYYDNDAAQLSTLGVDQYHRAVDLEVLSPELRGVADTYIIVPPAIWGYGSGPGKKGVFHVPPTVDVSLMQRRAIQIGKGLNLWSKVHVEDLAQLYIMMLERALQEPVDDDNMATATGRAPLPKNEDGYYFAQGGEDFRWGEYAQIVARVFKELGVNPSGEVVPLLRDEADALFSPMFAQLIGANSRCRAVKAREILGWDPKRLDFASHAAEELRCLIQEKQQQGAL
ncbi:hypothetical protein BGZ67_009642 [Mortierella alpina]|nr:hypothetical protein BGZ67_009642 [Mortierella alpina]